MTSPQEKQPREQRQKVKNENDTRFLEGEEHLQMDVDIYEDWMDTIGSSHHLQHLQQQQQQQQTQGGL
jgi:transcription elongation factor Elf1